jgi:predicted dehydrogenase
MSAVRVALIGATGHGASHRRTIAEMQRTGTVELVALGDVVAVPDADAPVFTDHRELLDRTSPDVVVVCTPPHTHLRIAADVMRSGADLLLEKPPVLDLAEHDALAAVMDETGRACQVGFQALGSPALAELVSAIDAGCLGTLSTVTARGAWKRDESYFRRSPWVGRTSVDGRPTVDGALANPFAHAVMQCLAIVRRDPPLTVEVDRYRTRDIEVDDTATLRLVYPDGVRVLVAVTLCAEEFVPGEIVVTGTGARAVLEYPTDRLALPNAPMEPRTGRPSLLANLIEHRTSGIPLIAPLSRTREFTSLLAPILATPAVPIEPTYLCTATDLPAPRLVIEGINSALQQAVDEVALLRELPLPWIETSPLGVA